MWSKVKKKLLKKEEEKEIDYLLIGLGNPKEKYKKTAHNIGFRVLTLFREENCLPPLSKDNTLNSLVTKGQLEEKRVAIVLPLTFMNLSGEAVRRSVKRFKVPLSNIIVVHDDIDLPIGTLRFSISRNSGGHKGVSSVIKALQTKDFARLRIGISKEEKESAKEVVLKNLPAGMTKIEEKASEELKESILKEEVIARTIKMEEKKNKGD